MARTPIDLSEDAWTDAPVFTREAPTPQRLSAELATLPSAPSATERVLTVTFREAQAILGLSRTHLGKIVRDGRLHEVGRDGLRRLLDRSEVEALASERNAIQFEKHMPPPQREQAQRERAHGLAADPKILEREMKQTGGPSVEEERHAEILEALLDARTSADHHQRRVVNALEGIERAVRDQTDLLSMIATGLGLAAAGAAVVAITPDRVKEEIKRKVAEAFRGRGTAPTVSLTPAGTPVAAGAAPISGAPRAVLDQAQSRAIASQFDSLMDELEAEKNRSP